jgi:putative endonuclease
MKYFLYILRSQKDQKLYIGITDNLERRLKEHNSGRSKSTKSRVPFSLVYNESFLSRSDAAKREWYFKNTSEGNKMMRELIRASDGMVDMHP